MAVTDDNWFKLLAIASPLFASSLAVSYDVGFFFGANIGYFTFFSLTEHLVFALQAIPFALGSIFTIAVLAAMPWFGYHYLIKADADAAQYSQQLSADERNAWFTKAIPKLRVYLFLNLCMQAAALILVGWQLSKQHYTTAFLAFVSLVLIKIAYSPQRWQSRDFRYGMAIFCITVLWVAAFLVGYERSQAIVSSTSPVELVVVEDRAIPARLIRAGERGVLFKSFETGHLSFLPWDKITRIDTF